MIGATPTGSYATQQGSKDVIVAVIDTGIDGSHPDIAPNFNKALSLNWTEDKPDIDGAVRLATRTTPATDPNDVDEDGHGTHVAGTIAAPINNFGMAGVAPNVTLVNDRAGQDSGFFFLMETIDALKYAGDIGADVANMSFYTDPWQFNCPGTPSGARAGNDDCRPTRLPSRRSRSSTASAIQAAVDYAIAHGVTLVAAAGNFHNNLDSQTAFLDDTSPDYPEGTEHVRARHRLVPRHADRRATGVISVSAIGPSKAKADYSNYGAGEETGGVGDDPAGEIDVAAPGGYFRDVFGTPDFMQPKNEILGPYPLAVARANHEVNGAGKPTTPFVVRDCSAEKTNTWADPSPQPGADHGLRLLPADPGHLDGLAARGGGRGADRQPVRHAGRGARRADDGSGGGAREAARDARRTRPCPMPATVDYTLVGRPASWNATCEGTAAYNGFYGDGIVNAQAAIAP